jgi:EAL domain-containing protein (putative c-di-GMP-specific phosphodiesterase class I)
VKVVFRATSVTAYLTARGTLENAQAMAAHDQALRSQGNEIKLDDVGRIAI